MSTLAVAQELSQGHELHSRIASHIRSRLDPLAASLGRWDDREADEELDSFLAFQETKVASNCNDVARDPDGFITWFEELRNSGPGQGDALFPWLAEHADAAAMRWFLSQELAGEAGFDDLVALTMVRLPARPKMEMARNLWDEFGRGNTNGVHSTLLKDMADGLGLSCPVEDTIEPVLALGNLMAGLALKRRIYQSIGALGVIELTAPGRVACVAAGMRRLGLPARCRRYFELHATIDIEHSRRWNSEVLHPLVAAHPDCAPVLARGALMRLEAGRRCFDGYRAVLWAY